MAMTMINTTPWQTWTDLPLLMTVEEVAGLLRCNPRTITRKIDRGELRASKPAGAWLVRREDVLELAGIELNVLASPV